MAYPKFLRRLVPEELRALLEKIDSIHSPMDSSYQAIDMFTRTTKLRWFENQLVRSAMKRVQREYALAQAMHIVIYNKMDRFESPEIDLDVRNRVTNSTRVYAKQYKTDSVISRQFL